MKSYRSLFIITLIGFGAAQARTSRRQASSTPMKKHLKELNIKINNAAAPNLGRVTAIFRFYGENTLGQPYVDGKVSIDNLKKKTGMILKSEDALYHGKNAVKEYFGKKGPEYVVLHKLSVGRWYLKWIGNILSDELTFKDGTQQRDFVVRIEKNRFGIPMYKLQPIYKSAMIAE
jgi:hypothetical protein